VTSIRARVLFGALLAAAVTFTVLATVSYHTAKKQLVYHFDDELRTHAGTLASLVHRDGDRLVLEFDDATLPFYRSSPKAEYFEVRSDDGHVIGRSASLGDSHLPDEWGTPDAPRIADVRLPDGHGGRTIGVRYALGSTAIRIAVAEPRHRLDEALERLIQSSAWTAAGLGLVLGVLLWIVLRLGLRPLEALSARVAGIDARHLPESLGMHAVPTELAPVVACLDDLLVRMRRSIERERRVTANIAHELQTPVAELRTVTDVALQWPDDLDYLRRGAQATNQIARRMESVTAKILELARVESYVSALASAPTDVAALLREVLAAVQQKRLSRSIRLTEDIPETVVVSTDAVALRVVLANLAQNAIEHAPSGTAVLVALAATVDVVFTFRNEAPDLAATDLPQLTEPYWRKDAARSSGDVAHAGIGLALASEIAPRLGGELGLTLEGLALVASLRLRSATG